ncbi:MAG TPA: hypothetical protein VLQ46_11735 [Casimicrobiaceae bacterium]|nr:hypothetical protein [Casimicrobiaceae bacterium]
MSEPGLRKIVTSMALAATACAGGEYRLDAPRSAAGVEIAPYAIHEECVELARGERIGYYFASAAPIEFNIHYHDGAAVILPVTREKVRDDAGEFTADRKEIYCLMWEAGMQPTILEYRIRLLAPR